MALLAGLALVAVRGWAVLRAQVLWQAAVGPLWWAVAAAFALMLAPLSGAGAFTGSLAAWLLAAGAELLLGTAIGTVVSLPGHALLGAGTASAVALRVSPRPLVALFVSVTLALGLALNVHQPLLASVTALQGVFALGRPEQWLHQATAQGLPWVLQALSAALLLALALATPVLLTTAVVDVGLRLLARGPAPAGPVVEPIRIWARLAAALLALGASWATFPTAWVRAMG